MIVLDTNVVAEAERPAPDANVLRWFKWQDSLSLYLCAPVLMEQTYGAQRFFERTGSERYLRSRDQFLERFRSRILDFNEDAPLIAGTLRARRESIGRPFSIVDSMIAAVCLVHGAALATRNVKDFDGLDLKLINPFEAGA